MPGGIGPVASYVRTARRGVWVCLTVYALLPWLKTGYSNTTAVLFGRLYTRTKAAVYIAGAFVRVHTDELSAVTQPAGPVQGHRSAAGQNWPGP